MNTLTRRIVWIALLTFLCAAMPLSGLAAAFAPAQLPTATPDGYVNDYAGVVNAADKAEMLAMGAALDRRTGAQIVVVTVEHFTGTDMGSYSAALFQFWGIGDKEKNNGVLIVLAVGDREIYVTVGTGLEASLSTDVLGWHLDTYAIPFFKQDRYSGGLRALYEALAKAVGALYEAPEATPLPGSSL